MAAGWVTVKRASKAEHAEMDEVIETLNEPEALGGTNEGDVRYTLEWHGMYVVVATWADGSEDRGSMVRCTACGHIRELFEGQIEFCTDCGADWEDGQA